MGAVPLIVALETATETGSVALLEGERLLAERELDGRQRHAARLLAELDGLLAAAGRGLEQVELIALSIGPGTFTGLRIGLATALGLAFGTRRKLAPVSTLAALALRAPGAAGVLPLLDARRGQVYAGLYGPDAGPRADDRVCDPQEVVELLPGAGEVTVLGSGADRHRELLEPLLGARVRWAAAGLTPRAADVGVLGARQAAAGGALDPADVEPRYLRGSDARPAALQRGSDRIP